MTTLGIYFSGEITRAEANAIRADFAAILADLGVTSGYHKNSSHGSPGLGLAYLTSGQLYIGLVPDEPYDTLLIKQLRLLADLYKSDNPPVFCDPWFAGDVGDELGNLADRLENALNRQDT